jgi:hypothetical protein
MTFANKVVRHCWTTSGVTFRLRSSFRLTIYRRAKTPIPTVNQFLTNPLVVRHNPINPSFIVFECLIYGLFAGCVIYASRRGRMAVLELLWAAVYGFVLEWITIKQLHAYQYGQFVVMIDDAPLCIGLAWAVIIYTSMEFSNRVDLPDHARPMLDALLALNIDLAFDIVAIRLGMWTWTDIRLDQDWFGVPFANLWAWFIVVWAFSTFIRVLRSWQRHRLRRYVYAPLAVMLSTLSLMVANEFYRFMSLSMASGLMPSLLLIVGSLLIVLQLRPRMLPHKLNIVLTAVPIGFHIFGTAAGFGAGIFAGQPIIGLVAVVMLMISGAIHLRSNRHIESVTAQQSY